MPKKINAKDYVGQRVYIKHNHEQNTQPVTGPRRLLGIIGLEQSAMDIIAPSGSYPEELFLNLVLCKKNYRLLFNVNCPFSISYTRVDDTYGYISIGMVFDTCASEYAFKGKDGRYFLYQKLELRGLHEREANDPLVKEVLERAALPNNDPNQIKIVTLKDNPKYVHMRYTNPTAYKSDRTHRESHRGSNKYWYNDPMPLLDYEATESVMEMEMDDMIGIVVNYITSKLGPCDPRVPTFEDWDKTFE